MQTIGVCGGWPTVERCPAPCARPRSPGWGRHSEVAGRGNRLDDGDLRRTGRAHFPDQGLDVRSAEKLLELLRRFPLVHEDDEAVADSEAVVDRPPARACSETPTSSSARSVSTFLNTAVSPGNLPMISTLMTTQPPPLVVSTGLSGYCRELAARNTWAAVALNQGPFPYQGNQRRLRPASTRSLSWPYRPQASVVVCSPPSRLSRSKSLSCVRWAPSSRSQVTARMTSAATCLTWEASSVGVRWRPSPAMAIVTRLVTRSVGTLDRSRRSRTISLGMSGADGPSQSPRMSARTLVARQ
jgi:hypothetical protein